MAKCKTCGEYYKKSRYNPTDECDTCNENNDKYSNEDYYDEEEEIEIMHLLHPSGKTPAKYYD